MKTLTFRQFNISEFKHYKFWFVKNTGDLRSQAIRSDNLFGWRKDRSFLTGYTNSFHLELIYEAP